MKVLITGGLGYVGGRLAEHLSARQPGAQVLLADLSVRGAPPAWAAKCRLLAADVMDKSSLSAAFKAEKVDAVVHLAALNDADCARDPERAMDVNVRGVYNTLQAASAAGVERFVYFSTFHVYGPAAGSDISEATPAMPAHPYGFTHRAAEDCVNYFRIYRGMKTLIFRMSNSFGRPMDIGVNAWTLVFNDLCRQLMREGHVTLKSAGTQHRDFIPLSDSVEAVRYFLFDIPEKWEDGLYNLGSGTSMTILEAAHRVERVYESKYGRKPGALVAPKAAMGAPLPAPVRFSVNKLKAVGFSHANDVDGEIARTLELCEGFSI